MEIWDAYDCNGNKVGVDLIRGEAIPDGYYHLVSEVIVRHIDGDFLLMQRDYCKTDPGKFECSAGGSALKNENALQAINRELLEETGLKAIQLKVLNKDTYEINHAVVVSFLAIVDTPKTQITFQKGETIGYKWLNHHQLLTFIDSDDFIQGRYKIRFLKNLEQI